MTKSDKYILLFLSFSPLLFIVSEAIYDSALDYYHEYIEEKNFRVQADYIAKVDLAGIENCAITIGIEHRKVFLAQVILETGWLKDSIMISKNNIIGMHKAYKRPTTQLNTKDSTSSLGTYKSIEACIWDYKIWQHINMQDKIYDDAGYIDKVIATRYNTIQHPLTKTNYYIFIID